MTPEDRENLLALIEEVEFVPADGPGPSGLVYFIVCYETGRCKIGFTKGHPAKRLASLQTGSPSELALIVVHPGTPDTERRLHERFADSRLRGEWFALTDELRAYMIATLWAMCEISLKEQGSLNNWMVVGLQESVKSLEALPESLAGMLEAVTVQ